MDHWKAFDSWSTAGPSNLLRYVERVSAAHGDDSGKEMFLNTAKLLATWVSSMILVRSNWMRPETPWWSEASSPGSQHRSSAWRRAHWTPVVV